MKFTAPTLDAPVERFMRKRPLALAAALLAVQMLHATFT